MFGCPGGEGGFAVLFGENVDNGFEGLYLGQQTLFFAGVKVAMFSHYGNGVGNELLRAVVVVLFKFGELIVDEAVVILDHGFELMNIIFKTDKFMEGSTVVMGVVGAVRVGQFGVGDDFGAG
jgi:hypothetical protein